MSILFSKIANPFANRSAKLASENKQQHPRAGFIDPTVVKTWHWNYGGDFFVIKFRTDTMQVWINDKEVTLVPSFANNEGHIEFEASRQKCEIRVSLATKHDKWRPKSSSFDIEKGRSANKKKLVYKLFVEGVSLGLPDSLEALMQRAASAIGSNIQPFLPGANDESQKALLSDTTANIVETTAATQSASMTKRPQKKSQFNLTLMTPPIYTAAGDPRDVDESSLSGDLQSLLIA